MQKFKLGLDYHGVIDRDPIFYSKFSRGIVYSGNEVHIITGNPETDAIVKRLHYLGIYWTHFYSIQDDLIARGHVPVVKGLDNSNWFDDDLWDEAKAEYCLANNISIHYDDTEKYGDHFQTPFMYVGI